MKGTVPCFKEECRCSATPNRPIAAVGRGGSSSRCITHKPHKAPISTSTPECQALKRAEKKTLIPMRGSAPQHPSYPISQLPLPPFKNRTQEWRRRLKCICEVHCRLLLPLQTARDILRRERLVVISSRQNCRDKTRKKHVHRKEHHFASHVQPGMGDKNSAGASGGV